MDFSLVDNHKPCLFRCWLLVWWLGTLPGFLWCPQFSGREAKCLLCSILSPLVRATIGGHWGCLLEEKWYWPCNRGFREGWGVSQIETGFGWQKTCHLAHCQTGPAPGCSAWCLVANSLRHGESQNSFPNPPPQAWVQLFTSQQIHKILSSKLGLLQVR